MPKRRNPPPRKPVSKFYLLSGRGEPVFLVNEEGESAFLDSLEAARESAMSSTMTRALGGVIIEWDDNGYVDSHDI